MLKIDIPLLSMAEVDHIYNLAEVSQRKRHPKILHAIGDEFNRVFNFMYQDSYMQPHLHPGSEKIEKIYIVDGVVAVMYFDQFGGCRECTILEKGLTEVIEVPAFTWHTYVILSKRAITYETMMGVYRPETWKIMATWAPPEGHIESQNYLQSLIKIASP